MSVFAAVLISLTVSQSSAKLPPDMRCGSYCAYVALRSLDFEVGAFADFEALLGQPGTHGYSMDQIQAAMREVGAEVVSVQTNIDDLQKFNRPFVCIALVSGHFITVRGIDGDEVSVVDPPYDYTQSLHDFDRRWDGHALIVSRQEQPDPATFAKGGSLWLYAGLGLLGIAAAAGFITAIALWRRKTSGAMHE